MPEIRAATSADLPAIGRTLAAAFESDPVWRHLAAPGADWDRWAARFFVGEAGQKLAGHGEVWVEQDVRGAAVWAPPKHWKATAREAVAVVPASIGLFRQRTLLALGTMTRMEKAHPRQPEHWYLAILGTDPKHQGSGVGSALIRRVTDRLDEEGLPAYLESSKEANVPFYERHGFRVREVIETPKGGPKLWTMWREPQPPEEQLG